MKRLVRRGQSIAEYAILLAVVIGAFAAMQVFNRRLLQARIRAAADALVTATGNTAIGGGGTTVTLGNWSQYEPYYSVSSADVYQEAVEQEHMGGGSIKKERVSDITARLAGATQSQLGANGRNARESNFGWGDGQQD